MPSLKSLAERAFVRSVSNPLLSRPMAVAADLRLPGPLLRALIAGYSRLYHVDMSEVAEPVHSFGTFNAFFTRRLREGARPVAAGEGVVVSPADSRLHSIGLVPEGGRIEQIKGRTYALEALLGDAQEAALFARGVHATLYLSPAMYHRVHSPVDGRILAWRYLPGRLFPVNAMAVRHVEGLFAVNERVCVRIETEAFGPVAVVFVGAANVGRISLSFAPDVATNVGGPATAARAAAPIPIARGAELGAFNLGSTVVLLAADPSLRPAAEPGRILKMGEALWQRA
jgi:phosphatidylserine decarboxylase